MNRTGNNLLHAVIIGAGPYGLSLAAHLHEAGVPFRIFGRPMQSWATQMPAGMKLKSDGFASNLTTGGKPFTLEDFCRITGRPYHHTQIPVAVEDFVAYGQEFARRCVPSLEERDVTSVEREGDVFRITVEGGDNFLTHHVLVATGVSLFQHVPSEFKHLPSDMVTHTAAHRLFDNFADRDITVLGRGASSLNAAVLAHEAGSRVTLLSRKYKVHIHRSGPAKARSLYQRLRHPASPLGSSLRSWMASVAPGLFRLLPAVVRKGLTYKHLGPSGGTALDGRVEGKFPMLLGWSIASAELIDAPRADDRRIKLTLTNAELETREHITSHVIAGTGFRVDLKRYHFLPQSIRSAIRSYGDGAPKLTANFETSVKGLYLVGPVAHATFGPLLRFAAGAEFAAEQVALHLQREFARLRPSKNSNFVQQPVRSTAK